MKRLSLTFNKMTSQAVEWTWKHTGVYATGDSGTNGLINKLRLLFYDLFLHPIWYLFLARFGCFLNSGFSQKIWDIIAKMNMSLS